jgi:branched-chain amino acid transport system permease protein
VRKLTLLVFLLLCALPLAAEHFGWSYIVSFTTRFLILSLAVIGLDLLVGYAGLINLCYSAFLGIGGYAAIILWKAAQADNAGWLIRIIGGDAILAWPVALLCVALGGLVLGYILHGFAACSSS